MENIVPVSPFEIVSVWDFFTLFHLISVVCLQSNAGIKSSCVNKTQCKGSNISERRNLSNLFTQHV